MYLPTSVMNPQTLIKTGLASLLCFIFLYSTDCHARRTIAIVAPSDDGISVTLDDSPLSGSSASNQTVFKVPLKPQLLQKKIWEKRTLAVLNNGSKKASLSLYLFGLDETILLYFPEHKRINTQVLLDIVGEYKKIIEAQKTDWDAMQALLADARFALEARVRQGAITEPEMKTWQKRQEAELKNGLDIKYSNEKYVFFQKNYLLLEMGITGIREGSLHIKSKSQSEKIAITGIYLDSMLAYNSIDKLHHYKGRPRAILLGENLAYCLDFLDSQMQQEAFRKNLSIQTGLSVESLADVMTTMQCLAHSIGRSEIFIHNWWRYLQDQMVVYGNYKFFPYKQAIDASNLEQVMVNRTAEGGWCFYSLMQKNAENDKTDRGAYLKKKTIPDERGKFRAKHKPECREIMNLLNN